jgi:two-component system KDP operon response regulator KdpE
MPATILIADGEDGYLSLMKAALIKEGFRVITSNSGHDALNLAQHEHPDLIILELGLPDMDGFEFMRHNFYDEQIPIIMLSGVAGIDDRVQGLELGADDFITKPFGLLELTSRVRAVLRRAGQVAPQATASRSIETVHGLDYNLAVA